MILKGFRNNQAGSNMWNHPAFKGVDMLMVLAILAAILFFVK